MNDLAPAECWINEYEQVATARRLFSHPFTRELLAIGYAYLPIPIDHSLRFVGRWHVRMKAQA